MSSNLCKYSAILGLPKEGVHSARIGPFALNDILATVLVSVFLAFFLNKNVIIVFLLLMILAIALHRLFCVNTALNVMIFGKK